MILYQQSFICLQYNQELACLTQHWKGFASSSQFRQAIQETVHYVESKGIDKLISNTKDFAGVKKEDTDWVANVATPKMVQKGLKTMAFIVPTNVFTQVSVNNFKNKADELLQIQYFDDLQTAHQWLATSSIDRTPSTYPI